MSRGFCLLKTASKCTQSYHLGDKNDFFLGVDQPLHHTLPLDACGASPLPY